ncbi:MAG: hypothetical protein ACREUX_11000 [Burkholderiales bacterium]
MSTVCRLGLMLLAAGLSATSWAQLSHIEDVRAEDVRAIAAAGAVELALERVERSQPPRSADPGWAEWELARLDLLSRRQRYADVLARVKTHAPDAGDSQLRASLLNVAAGAAVALGRFEQARGLLVQAFVHTEKMSAGDYRAARLTAIDAYLGEGRADPAYLAMLRFRQDFAPLQPAEVERFVAGLLAVGRADEAAQWLAQLGPDSPRGAMLRLRAGLIQPAAAAAQARALLAKGVIEPGWALLSAAGRAAADPEIELEVLEGRLNVFAITASSQADSVAALWKAYVQVAERAANAAQLLTGDDAQWAQAASRMRPKRPRIARALTASLVVNARTPAARVRAQSQLLAWLRDAGLARTAWRLFSDANRFPVAQMDSQVRFELGMLAAEVGEAASGIRYWQGLPPMEGMGPSQWQARNLALLLQAGMIPQALSLAGGALEAKPRLDAESVRRITLAASDALDFGHAEAARIVFQGLLAHVDDVQQRAAVLTGLARAHESGGDPRAAAEAYLLAAVSAKDPHDPAALAAREAAAANLLRAGLRADARAVFEWIARNARSADARQAAERRLSRL